MPDIRPGKIGILQACISQVRIGQLCPYQDGIVKNGPAQITIREIRTFEVCRREICVAKICALQLRMAQINMCQGGPVHVGKAQVNAGQHYSLFTCQIRGTPPQSRFRGLFRKIGLGKFRLEVVGDDSRADDGYFGSDSSGILF